MDILVGDVAPSGKLPFTIAKREEDYSSEVQKGDDDYAEGLFVDYRYFEKMEIEPRYAFGFGLSYTSFDYSDLNVSGLSSETQSEGIAPGGLKKLYDIVATVSVTVTNSGTVEGKEVVQLYVSLPASAPETPGKQLSGFEKIGLKAGESGKVVFELRRKDLSFWDVEGREWVLPKGGVGIMVGASSRDIRFNGTLSS